ncbi:hypothetical protein GCM10022216_04860 [Sphingobacterium kyonggiense]|uniref:Uncharacterized protein n=1 Tax=Sphingobacterium kyonggiense TaxID=714075 RepID=A0ABP7YAJ2_9SPHI
MKLTPLNISLACILVWAITEMGEEGQTFISWGWLAVLVVFLIAMDILFRLWTKDVKRLWIMQLGFILVVGIISIVIKSIF